MCNSDMADKVFFEYFNDAYIIDCEERLFHDGYDRDGPESNLWHLHIIADEAGVYMYYYFNCEDWFNRCPVEYELDYKASVESIYNADENDKNAVFHKSFVKQMGSENEDYCEFIESLAKKA